MCVFVVTLPSWSNWDPWAARVFPVQEKEREANGVEMHSKLGCKTQQGSPHCVTPSSRKGNELFGGRKAEGDAVLHGVGISAQTSAGSAGETRQGFVGWANVWWKCDTVKVH